MKKLYLLILCFALGSNLKAQDVKAVFKCKEIIWYGLDFSKAKFNLLEPVTMTEVKTKLIPSWNDIIIKEYKNYDLMKTFKKENVHYDLKSVNLINSLINVDSMQGTASSKIDRTTIEGMVSGYGNGDQKQGIGLVFIVESFNKETDKADLYLTFFDIETKKVLFCERVTGNPQGMSLRNYWAGAIKSILHHIEYSEWGKWSWRNK